MARITDQQTQVTELRADVEMKSIADTVFNRPDVRKPARRPTYPQYADRFQAHGELALVSMQRELKSRLTNVFV